MATPKKPDAHKPPPAGSMLAACLPGGIRVTMLVYDAHVRQYRPLAKRHIRVAVDSPEQAHALWKAVTEAVNAEVETWAPLGAEIDLGYAVEAIAGEEAYDVDEHEAEEAETESQD